MSYTHTHTHTPAQERVLRRLICDDSVPELFVRESGISAAFPQTVREPGSCILAVPEVSIPESGSQASWLSSPTPLPSLMLYVEHGPFCTRPGRLTAFSVPSYSRPFATDMLSLSRTEEE